MVLVAGIALLGADRAVGALRLLHGGVDYHPDASHSLLLGGSESVMCARNTGIYCGVLLTALWAWTSGRGTACRFPPRRVMLALGALAGIMAVDGLNSLLADMGYWSAYEPSNLLRLATGLGAGVAAGAVFVPVLNGLLWTAPRGEPFVPSLRALLALLAWQAAFYAPVAVGIGALALPLALATTGASLALFGGVNLLALLIVLRRENAYRRVREAIPLVGVAVGLALLELAGLAWLVRGVIVDV